MNATDPPATEAVSKSRSLNTPSGSWGIVQVRLQGKYLNLLEYPQRELEDCSSPTYQAST